MVVDGHRLPHHLPGLRQVCRFVQQQRALEDAVDTLSQRVLVAIVAIGHRASQPMALVDGLVVIPPKNHRVEK